MNHLAKTLNALIILTLSGILLGAFSVQFFMHEQPCPLCMLQRVGMIGVAIGLLLNLRFGIKTQHYGLALLSALMGGVVALRQISLHVCPGSSVFGIPVLGLSLYTWSFLIFACVVLAIALLLFIYNPRVEEPNLPKMNLLSKIALVFIFLVTVANVFSTLFQCGLGPCSD